VKVSGPRIATLVHFGVHVAYGVVTLAVPGRIGKPWLGRSVPSAPSDVPLRGVGGREVTVHLAGAAAILQGASLRPWLLASLGGDLTDIVATVAQRKQLPPGGLRACLVTGGASALMTLGLLAADDAS
jgi:hypothetical protein